MLWNKENFIKQKQKQKKVMEVLTESEGTLSAGYISWRKDKFNGLYPNKRANELFIEVVKENFLESPKNHYQRN